MCGNHWPHHICHITVVRQIHASAGSWGRGSLGFRNSHPKILSSKHLDNILSLSVIHEGKHNSVFSSDVECSYISSLMTQPIRRKTQKLNQMGFDIGVIYRMRIPVTWSARGLRFISNMLSCDHPVCWGIDFIKSIYMYIKLKCPQQFLCNLIDGSAAMPCK